MSLDVTLYDGGYCTHLEKMVMKGARCSNVDFPAMFVHIHHPVHGHILYDTAYSNKFFEETSTFPGSLYAKLTPVFLNKQDTAVEKLAKKGISPEDINYIIISHFHADHIGAIRDFPNAKFIFFESSWLDIKGLKGFRALLKGVLPGLIPENFEERAFMVNNCKPVDSFHSAISKHFVQGFDIFNDGSLIAVELPGHAAGQVGLYINEPNRGLFMIADACWMSKSFETNTPPSSFAHIITHNKKEYADTLTKIHRVFQEKSDLEIIPSHCGEKFCTHVNHTYLSKDNLNGCSC